MRPLYFDYNATTPVHPHVLEAMVPWLTTRFGNPGSAHSWGREAKKGLEASRHGVASSIGAQDQEIIFTSGATESNNLVLYGVLTDPENQHLVISGVEHPAIMEPARALERQGLGVSVVPVDHDGRVRLEDVQEACTPKTSLISLMLANNEVGTIQPVRKIARWAREQGICIHTDAAQAVGKIPVDVEDLSIDLMSIAGHKLYAPKGIGGLYVRKGTEILPRTRGGGQEHGIRPGTENIPYIAGFAAACGMIRDLGQESKRQGALGERFRQGLGSLGRPFVIHAEHAPRLPGTMSVGFEGYRAPDILSGLVTYDVGVSAGAACHAGTESVSPVLTAMGIDRDHALGTIRFSWGRMTPQEDVDALLERLEKVFQIL
ncbi:cysteine desulfurase family protein [Desulfoplanes sp.]